MGSTIRALILVEAASLAVAAALHSGAVTGGPFQQAAYYEGTIAGVLAVGLVVTYLRPGWTRPIALGTQVFALLGAFIGLYGALVGFGPNTPADIVYHFALIGLLAWGIVVAWRLRDDTAAIA
jgi:hypothetical protein